MADLQLWALPRLQRLLPLDEQALKEVIQYSISLSKQDSAEHLKNLLGDSPQALEFISSFNSRRTESSTTRRIETPIESASTAQVYDERVPASGKKGPKKSKPPLHSLGPARQPEGYGDVSGGYQKSYDSSSKNRTNTLSNALSLTQTPEALQVPNKVQVQSGSTGSSPAISRDPSPGSRDSSRLPPSAAGKLISDLPNVRSKQSKKSVHQSHSQSHSGIATPSFHETTITSSSVADLSAAIAALELSTNPTLSSSELRKCPCNASIHPLFTTAPNCLNCGKIICALEGLQPCSFCGSAILSKEQVNSMIKALKEERGVERMAIHNAGVSRSGRGTPTFGASTPESVSGDEASSAAVRARAHRDKLLAFQRENAQRTQVHDEAADYDTGVASGTMQWMSPVQRAAALKKQQKYLRELEEANRPEWEKKKTVMSMSIKNGKLVKTFQRESNPGKNVETDHSDSDLIEDGQSEGQHLSVSGGGAFSNNPLLASGKLVRPIWKSQSTEKGSDNLIRSDKPAIPRESVWRRVQVDQDDNEAYILDGGLYGHGTEARLMEDGSQQERG